MWSIFWRIYKKFALWRKGNYFGSFNKNIHFSENKVDFDIKNKKVEYKKDGIYIITLPKIVDKEKEEINYEI